MTQSRHCVMCVKKKKQFWGRRTDIGFLKKRFVGSVESVESFVYRKRVFVLPIQICKNEVHDVRELCKIKKKLIKKHFFSKILQNFHPVFTEQKKKLLFSRLKFLFFIIRIILKSPYNSIFSQQNQLKSELCPEDCLDPDSFLWKYYFF